MTKQKKHLRHSKYGRLFRAGSRIVRGGKMQLRTTAEGFLETTGGELKPLSFVEKDSGLVVAPVANFPEGWETAATRYRRVGAAEWVSLPDNVSTVQKMQDASEKYFFVAKKPVTHEEPQIEDILGVFGLVRASGEIVNFFMYEELSVSDKRDIIKKMLPLTPKPLTVKVKATETEKKNFWETLDFREDMTAGEYLILKKTRVRERPAKLPTRIEDVT